MRALAQNVKMWRRKDLLAHMTNYRFRQMIKEHRLTRVTHGIYALASAEESDSDIVLAQQFYPQAIMSMFTAADFHGLTTTIPRAVQITMPSSGTRRPEMPDYPAVEFFFAGANVIDLGCEVQKIDGYPVRIYDRERVVCDMFRYLRRSGLDMAIEVFKSYMDEKKKRDVDKLLDYARKLRVYKYISNYVEVYIG